VLNNQNGNGRGNAGFLLDNLERLSPWDSTKAWNGSMDIHDS
jgi:hypothetical protein